MNRVERGYARAAEQVVRTRELMPSGQLQNPSRWLPETPPPSQVRKTQIAGVVGYEREGNEWLGTQVLEVHT